MSGQRHTLHTPVANVALLFGLCSQERHCERRGDEEVEAEVEEEVEEEAEVEEDGV